jgi:methionine synthase II (cobalamin-independent)
MTTSAGEGGVVRGTRPCLRPAGAGSRGQLFRDAGAGAVSVDASRLGPADDEALGTAVEAGTALWLGVVPSTDAELGDLGDTVRKVRGFWNRLGFAPALLPGSVLLTPACGLAGASPAYARAALARVREAARAIAEDPEG